MPVLIPKSGVSLSKQLEEILREKIISREWNIHECIPSELQISEQYGVSRSTVRAALGNLVQDGMLYRRQGKGTFVAPPHEAVTFDEHRLGIREKLDTLMPTPVARVVREGPVAASEQVAELMGIPAGEQIYEVVRARYRLIPGSSPCMVQYSWMPMEIGRQIETEELIMARLTFQIAEKCGLHPVKMKEWIEASLVSPFEAKELRVSQGSPVLIADELAYCEEGTPYLFTRFVVLAHMMRLSFG